MKQKLAYFLGSLQKCLRHEGFDCPNCSSPISTVVDRKWLVTALRRCKKCQLLFRTPTTTEMESQAFYQSHYSEGFTTSMPSPKELDELKKRGFAGTLRNYSYFWDILKSLESKEGIDLLEFGCSWGYGSWQLMKHGYRVKAIEISKPRAEYARRHLGVDVYTSLEDVEGNFDIVFSVHVLEHIAHLRSVLDHLWRLVKPGGLFVCFTPNGSRAYRSHNPRGWRTSWGNVHPNLLDEAFFDKVFSSHCRLITSNPYSLESLREWGQNRRENQEKKLVGCEMLTVVAKPKRETVSEACVENGKYHQEIA